MLRLLLLFGLAISGCAALRVGPNPKFVKKLSETKYLEIGDVYITDKGKINTFLSIYKRASWRPFLDTVPGDLVSIYGMRDGVELCKINYGAGWLIETNGNECARKGILSEEDRKWMDENIRSLLPPSPGVI